MEHTRSRCTSKGIRHPKAPGGLLSNGFSFDRLLDPNNVISSRIIEMIPDRGKVQRNREGIGSSRVRLGKKFGCVRGN